MDLKNHIRVICTLSLMVLCVTRPSRAQEIKLSPALEEGIGHYKHENYDEALPLLIQAREEDPQSTLAAYYLGLNYKQLQNYRKAIPPLRDAVTYLPKIKGALIELIDCLYQYDELEEAQQWIREAEREGIRPAHVAFLKGLVLIKEEKFAEATLSLENAKALDHSMEQAANYQIGIAHLKAQKLAEAEDAFHDVVDLLPSTSLAQYAREYLDVIIKRKEALRPLRLTFTTAWQYDDNVVLKPEDASVATDIADESDWRTLYNMQIEHNHPLDEPYGLKGQYTFNYAKQNDLGFYNTMAHTVLVQPGINFPTGLWAFPTVYNHTIVNERSYLSNPSTGMLYNHLVGETQMGQAHIRYNHKNFLWTPLNADEDRDSHELGAGLGWYWFFADKKGILNLRYGYNRDWARGNNWGYHGQRLNATVLLPILEKLNLVLSGGAFLQDYVQIHTVFGVKRDDKVYSGSALFTYRFHKNAEIQLQYARVNDDSNINIYQYERNIYSAGVQVRY